MNKILSIIKKDILIRFTSPSEWLFFLVLPIIFTLIIGASTGPGEDSRIQIYIVDQANNALSENLINTLQNSSSVHPKIMKLEDALSDFDQRKVAAVLIIPETFTEDNLLQHKAELELRQLPNTTDALVAQQAVQAVLGRVSSTYTIAMESIQQAESQPGFNFESIEARQTFYTQTLEKAQQQLAEAPDRLSEVIGNTREEVNYDAGSTASAGQLITWVFIPLIGLSVTFAYERQKGTLRRLLTTPTSKATFLAGTIIGQVLTALLQMTLLVLFGIFVMKLDWSHDILALAVMLVSSALAAAALGTMLGTFVKSEAQANGLSIMFGMVMALLGGCWYPLELFPQAVQHAVKILPTTWAMKGLLDIVQRGQGLTTILPDAGILLGFAALFFIVGILRFKYE